MGKKCIIAIISLIIIFQLFILDIEQVNAASKFSSNTGGSRINFPNNSSQSSSSSDESNKDLVDRIRIQKSTTDKSQEYLKYYGNSKIYNADFIFEMNTDFKSVYETLIVQFEQDQEDAYAADLADILPITKRSLDNYSASSSFDLDSQSCEDVSSSFTKPYQDDTLTTNPHKTPEDNYAKSCIWPALTNNISSIQNKQLTIDEYTPRNILQLYCLSLFSKQDTWRIYFEWIGKWAWKQTFDSHQSLFLYALCSSFKDKTWTPFYNWNSTVEGAFKWDIKQKLWLKQMAKWKDNCSLDNDNTLEDCDMAIYATQVYSWIMSDLYKIKYSQVLNVDSAEWFNVQRKVEDFFRWYYLIYDPYVLLKRRYPRTVRTLESNQTWHKTNHLDTLKIIDNSKLSNMGKWCNGNETWLRFIACALHSSQVNGFALTQQFVTLLYNEIYNYYQFMMFYQKWLELKVEAMGRDKTREKKVRIYQGKSTDFKRYYDMQMEGTNWAERWFEEFNMSYPLHICILLEQEGGRCLLRGWQSI